MIDVPRFISYLCTYIPDHVQSELEHIISSWRNVEKRSDRFVIGGDFNQADAKCPELWKKFLALFTVVDVHPTLATYLFSGGTSALDRILVPEEWVSTARWNPEVRTLNSSLVNGHKILKIHVKVRPTVLNNPNDCLHETIPTEAFMPGKNGRFPKDNRALQSLVRLLHRTHKSWFANVIPADGFRLGDSTAYLRPVGTYCLPGFIEDNIPNQMLPVQQLDVGAEELVSDRDVHSRGDPSEPCDVGNQMSPPFVQRTDTDAACSEDETCHEESPRPRRHDGEFANAHLEDLMQLPQIGNFHLSISACFWSWWRSLPPEANPAHNRPFLKARKFVHLPAQWVNVPRHVIEDLIYQSQGAVLSSLDGLIISNGSVSLPRASIQAMFEVIDDCLTGTPYLPSDSTDSQVRGLGSMVAFWERMRNICPQNQYLQWTHSSERWIAMRDFQ